MQGVIEGAHAGAVVVDPPELEIHYPEGEPVPEGNRHWHQLVDVALALEAWLRRRPDGDRIVVRKDNNIYYTEGDIGDVVAPDVAVAFGADVAAIESDQVYKVWKAGVVPTWVLEVASPRTFRADVRDKPAIYAARGVLEYWRTDPSTEGLLDPPLQGERLTGGSRSPIAVVADADGTLRGHSDLIGLDLCWNGGELRLHDPATGAPLPTYDDLMQARTSAETARAASDARAEQAAARAAREAARAAGEAARAEQEAAARAAAEAELAALRRRLGPPSSR